MAQLNHNTYFLMRSAPVYTTHKHKHVVYPLLNPSKQANKKKWRTDKNNYLVIKMREEVQFLILKYIR